MIKIKLHLLMAENRMSQKDVSEKTGIHAPTINKYYHDTYQKMDKEHIGLLCKLFNCKVQDLIEYIPDNQE
ncbi:MAG: helix-turn-helix domain-containing protein [Fusobacteriaceae bacterium]